jgi:hypothetical protein
VTKNEEFFHSIGLRVNTMTDTDSPSPPTSSPIVWHGFGRMMVPPKFAIWFPQQRQFQVFEVSRERYPALTLNATLTNRGAPWYFWSTLSERESRNVILFKPRGRTRTHVEVAMWFTGAWLCRKTDANRMQCVLPVLGISNMKEVFFRESLGIHENADFHDWVQWQTPDFYRMILRNRIYPPPPEPEIIEKPPAPVPVFVAEILLKDAMTKEHCCPISMEPVKPGETTVTSCFHIFQTQAIQEWCKGHCTCPVCKQSCVMTHI